MKINNSLFIAAAGLFIGSSTFMNGQNGESIIAEDQPRSFVGRKTGTWTPKSLPQGEAALRQVKVVHQPFLLQNLKEQLTQAKNNNEKKAAIDRALNVATDDTRPYLDKAKGDLANAISYIDQAIAFYSQESGIYSE